MIPYSLSESAISQSSNDMQDCIEVFRIERKVIILLTSLTLHTQRRLLLEKIPKKCGKLTFFT